MALHPIDPKQSNLHTSKNQVKAAIDVEFEQLKHVITELGLDTAASGLALVASSLLCLQFLTQSTKLCDSTNEEERRFDVDKKAGMRRRDLK
ncbi:hypothetical protein Droror1_Dr00025568, partial [Drosera rotundifolia]